MEKKKIEKKKIEKKSKSKSTEVQTCVDKLINAVSGNRYNDPIIETSFYIDDYLDYEDNAVLTPDQITSVSKKITEKSAYNAVKNSKSFQKSLDRVIKDIASNLTSSLIDAKKELERTQKYEAQQRVIRESNAKKNAIKNAKNAVKNAALAEKIKKENAQMNIFKEGLTDAQKKAFKKFCGIDINKHKGKSLPAEQEACDYCGEYYTNCQC